MKKLAVVFVLFLGLFIVGCGDNKAKGPKAKEPAKPGASAPAEKPAEKPADKPEEKK